MSVNRAALPAPLYTAEQTRALDRIAIEQFSIPGIRLMQRAGHAVFAEMVDRYAHLASITVLCGGGNNGGDGFVIAQLAIQKGMAVQLICVGAEDFSQHLSGEAKQAWLYLQEVDSTYERYHSGMVFRGDLIIDALLGTGLAGAVRGDFCAAIEQINRAGKPVIAVDIPSGLCADTGRVLDVAVKADVTLSFIGLKRGLFTSEAVDYCGELLFDALKVPAAVYEQVATDVYRTTRDDLAMLLAPRARSSHKGRFGHVLVIGGNHGMGGAALLAAESVLRSGAGLVSLATRQEHLSASLSRCPEVMVHAVENVGGLKPLLEKADVVVIGPGLGQSAWSQQMLLAALKVGKRLVLDADALNLMASQGYLDNYKQDNWICTPHPGEAARLLNQSVAETQRDRFETVRALQQICGGAVVLKGAGSLSCSGNNIHLCDKGNPGMAVGGMGDVLSGICGAFLAQGLEPEDAARLAVYVHALSADGVVQEQGEIGLFASDLCRFIPKVINCKYD